MTPNEVQVRERGTVKSQLSRAWKQCLPLLILTVMEGGFLSAAQSVPSTPTPAGPELKQRPDPPPPTGEIKLDVVVTDKKRKPITGLEAKDFTLLDNRTPTEIVSFASIESNGEGASVAAQAIILLDAVNVGYLSLVQTRDEVAKFLRRDGGHLPLPVSLYLFTDDGATELAAPSTDGNVLAAELDKTKATFRTIGRSGGVSVLIKSGTKPARTAPKNAAG